MRLSRLHVILAAVLAAEIVAASAHDAPSTSAKPRHASMYDCVVRVGDNWLPCDQFPWMQRRA